MEWYVWAYYIAGIVYLMFKLMGATDRAIEGSKNKKAVMMIVPALMTCAVMVLAWLWVVVLILDIAAFIRHCWTQVDNQTDKERS